MNSTADQVVSLADRRQRRHRWRTGAAAASVVARVEMSEQVFRWMMNEDAMATEKTAEGIRKFGEDILKLEKLVQAAIV